MRAVEFITEERAGKLHKDAESVMPGAHRMRDAGGYDRTYHLNRVMMAAACHDGKSKKPVSMSPGSWSEKYNTAHPYTKEEDNMIHGALRTVGAEHDEAVADHRSLEPDDVHKVSPVAGFKGYKRK